MLLGLDTESQVTANVIATGPDLPENDPVRAEAAASTLLLPGPLPRHVDLIAELFRAHKVVAAVHIAETWVVEGDAAFDVIRRTARPSGHPDRQEGVLVVGHWPAGLSTVVLAGRIFRDLAGWPSLIPEPDPTPAPIRSGGIVSWLDLLPGLTGHRPVRPSDN